MRYASSLITLFIDLVNQNVKFVKIYAFKVYFFVGVSICMYVCMCICMYECIYICIMNYVHMYVSKYVCMHVPRTCVIPVLCV